jgi:hypothetical protein
MTWTRFSARTAQEGCPTRSPPPFSAPALGLHRSVSAGGGGVARHVAEPRMPEQVVPVRMGGEPGDHREAEPVQVIGELVQLRAIDARIDQDQPALPAHRDGIAPDPRTLPDPDAVGHLSQHRFTLSSISPQRKRRARPHPLRVIVAARRDSSRASSTRPSRSRRSPRTLGRLARRSDPRSAEAEAELTQGKDTCFVAQAALSTRLLLSAHDPAACCFLL